MRSSVMNGAPTIIVGPPGNVRGKIWDLAGRVDLPELKAVLTDLRNAGGCRRRNEPLDWLASASPPGLNEVIVMKNVGEERA